MGNDQVIHLFDESSPGAAELLDTFHEEILRPSFPPEEYVPRTTTGQEDGPALIACGDDGQVLGGALGEIYPVSASLLLGYLAVRPGLRGMGIGSMLLAAVRERWLNRDSLMFLELDDPRYHPPHPGYGDPVARLRFYGAFGVRLLAIPYFQPRLRDYLPRAYHMFLGILPPDGVELPASMPEGRVSAFLREYFENCEGSDPQDDPEVRWLLDAFPGPEIPLVGTDEISRVPGTMPAGAQ